MARLSPPDAKLFHKLMDALLFYANSTVQVMKNCPTKEAFFKHDIEKTVPLREKMFSKDSQIMESFIKENPEHFNSEELNIISSWKVSKEGKFFLVKHTKEHALLLSSKEQKVYGVLGITDSFSEKFNGFAPVMMKIRLLPFKGKIIYEGIFFPYQVSFGGGMRSSLKVETEAAIQKYGIITSLDVQIIEKKNSDEDMLRFYFKTQDNRDRYFKEIEKLKKKSPELEAIYYQEEAAIVSRDIKKSLKANGVKGYFAVLVNAVVASGLTEKELKENIRKIVPGKKQGWLYQFKL
ncbi:MAG: hypothetical protein V1743_01365 [Nanoarchaeota archaeon]